MNIILTLRLFPSGLDLHDDVVPELPVQGVLERHVEVIGFPLLSLHALPLCSQRLNPYARALGANECCVLVAELLKANVFSEVSHLLSLETCHN